MLFDAYEIIKEKMPSVPHLFGAHHIAGSHSRSCVVWVPSEDEIGPPMNVGQNPKAHYSRAAGADLYIFGISGTGSKEANHKATELLLHEVLVKLHEEYSGNISFERIRWGLRQQDQWMTFGGACVLPVFIGVPVVELARPTATPKAMEPMETAILPQE